MVQHRPLLRAAQITALILAIPACSTSPTEVAPTPVDAATGVQPGVPAAEQQDQQDLKRQRDRFLAQQNLRNAQQARLDGNLQLAKSLLMQAAERDPSNTEVRRALASVLSELGETAGSPATFQETMEELRKIQQQRALALVNERVQRGQQLLDELNFDQAIQEFRSAIQQIDALPTMDWGTSEANVRTLLADAEDRRTAHEIQVASSAEREAIQRLRDAEDAETARVTARINALLQSAQEAFALQSYTDAQQLASLALEEDPNNALAKDIFNSSAKSGRMAASDRYHTEKVQEYLRLEEHREDLMLPQTELLVIDGEVWRRALARSAALDRGTAEIPEDTALMQRIRDIRVGPVQFTEDGNGPYADAFRFLDTYSTIPIIISPEGQIVIDDEGLVLSMDIVAPMTLENLLNHMVSLSENLGWMVFKGVVVITDKTMAGGENVQEFHDVRNLIFPITEFLPPSIREIPLGDVETLGGRTGGEGEESPPYVELAVLVDNIIASTDPTYWDGDSGASIEQLETGYLVVTANPEMQARVRGLLADLQRFATAVVTVETKFLNLNDSFLQQIGVDFRGLGGSSNKGTVAVLDDITNGNDDNASQGLDNLGTADPAGSPGSGFFYNDGGDGDFRARNENFFEDTLGKILTPTGGLTGAITFLDDLEVSAVFQAIEKNESAELLNTQRVTVLNNNRANLAVVNQISYVRDFNVEVAQASFIADPKIDVIHDGIVLDVRPVIRHDRKSVTLTIEPTVARLVRPIPTFTTSLGGSTLPVLLQLPELLVQTFSTTIQVPDGGTVLIGGLRTILNRERRAEAPILGKIPIISFFFKQEGVVDESTTLMVMVKAAITDVVDTMNSYPDK